MRSKTFTMRYFSLYPWSNIIPVVKLHRKSPRCVRVIRRTDTYALVHSYIKTVNAYVLFFCKHFFVTNQMNFHWEVRGGLFVCSFLQKRKKRIFWSSERFHLFYGISSKYVRQSKLSGLSQSDGQTTVFHSTCYLDSSVHSVILFYSFKRLAIQKHTSALFTFCAKSMFQVNNANQRPFKKLFF
jgi:hypothetical protein